MTRITDSGTLSNAEIADRLSSLAQMLTMEKANPYKVRAYRRAAAVVRGLGESIDEMVRSNADLRIYAGIGEAIRSAIREIVETGTLKTLEKLRSNSSPELVELSAHPRLDPKRVLRIEQPELQDRLIRAKAQQQAEFVLSPWHLYEIGKARPEIADSTINFLERIDPVWIATRIDLQTVEFAAVWLQFWQRGGQTPAAVGSLTELYRTAGIRPPATRGIRAAVSEFQTYAAREHMRTTLEPHREVAALNRKDFRRGQFGTGLRKQVEIESAALHLARMNGFSLGSPSIFLERQRILHGGLIRAQIEFFIDFGGIDELRAARIEWELSLQFYETDARLDTNRWVDREHAVSALPYCDMFVTDDRDLTRRIAAIRAKVPFPIAEVINCAEFSDRFR